MSKNTRRALRVTLAVAGTAVLCAAFVGTASAAPSLDEATDAPNANNDDTSSSVNDTKVPDSGLLSNDLITAEMPEIKGASYYSPETFRAVPASSPDDDEDRDDVCHGLGGEHEYDHDTKIQVPCQSDDNDIADGEFEIAGHAVAYMTDIPGLDADGGDSINQNGDQAESLSDGPGALTNGLSTPENLNHVNGQKVAVSPV